MIRITCDNCEQIIEADPKDAGGKVSCPHCGDVNRVPATEPAPTRIAAEPTPEPAAGREREICIVRPAMFRAHPLRFVMIAAVLVGGLVAAGYSMFGDLGAWLGWLGLILTIAAVIWYVGWWVSSHFWRKLIVSDKRTIRHEGIITRHTTEVLHDHVRSVDIRQTFLQRIFNVGSVGIDSAGQDEIEIEIHDIPRPYQVKEIIDRYRKM